MPIKLFITLLIVAIVLIVSITCFLIKGKINEKYALLWYCFPIMIILVTIFQKQVEKFANLLGFEIMSNMIIVIVLGLSLIFIMALTVMIANQKKKSILLIQELSILKNRISDLENKLNKK